MALAVTLRETPIADVSSGGKSQCENNINLTPSVTIQEFW